jgi:hypothetical protein
MSIRRAQGRLQEIGTELLPALFRLCQDHRIACIGKATERAQNGQNGPQGSACHANSLSSM